MPGAVSPTAPGRLFGRRDNGEFHRFAHHFQMVVGRSDRRKVMDDEWRAMNRHRCAEKEGIESQPSFPLPFQAGRILKLISTDGAECVNAPIEIRSTPASA